MCDPKGGRVLDGLQQLIDLQALDEQRSEVRGRQERIPEQREALAEAGAAAEAAVASASEALQEAEAHQRRAETELQDHETLVQRLEGQQPQVKTNEAYTALLHEIDAAREAISSCETQILEAMETIETWRSQRAGAEARRDRERTRIDTEGKSLNELQAELETRHAALDADRETRVAEIDSEWLAQYEKVARRLGTGVARVSHETCQGCRVDIPPQLHIELLRGERLITCQRCKRILIPEK
jgi:hypothetical protein